MSLFLVDVDGVVADLHSEWLRLYNEDYDDGLIPESIVSWDISQFVKPECGNKIFDYLWKPELYENVLPIDGALSSIQWLRKQGHRVVFLTSGIQPAKVEWLFSNGFLIGPYWQSDKDVVIASDKSLVKGDYLIDDSITNCDKFPNRSIVFAQPWNEGTSHFRADGWAEVVSHISINFNIRSA